MKEEWRDRVLVWGGRAGCFLADTAVMLAAYVSAFLLRFDFHEPWWGWRSVALSFITVWIVQSAALTVFGCNKLLWRYVSVGDVPRFIGAVMTSTVVLLVSRLLFPTRMGLRPPYSISFFNSFLVLGGLLGMRILWRFVVEGDFAWDAVKRSRARRALLVGAGAAGNLAARELNRQSGRRVQVVGFLDDDPAKQRAKMQGHAVLGRIEDLPDIVRRHAVESVIISMVRVPRDVICRVVRLCERAHVPARIVPGYYELLEGTLTASKIRDIDVADLLGREESKPDVASVIALLGGKCVLVTGAGGSIGSELVRQILLTGPELLVMIERSENALYEIEREIRKLCSEIPVVAVLADIGERARMSEIFLKYKPLVVIHAAAHKHVPLMEQNPVEAIKNNVLATRVLGELALEHGVERFVLISTDKAVRPVSVMGITKRLAEMALQDLNRIGRTHFSAVRFGNVLDSSGSVVPLFREQIRKGEVVTVTHPDMKRYFMTISEAVSLVLQAAALAEGGEIFVLDMGEPVKIVELAEEIIALSGLRPHEDVPIMFTGIRPGEKLFEELDVSEKSTYKTGHARIYVSKISLVDQMDVDNILDACHKLCECGGEADDLRATILGLLSGGKNQNVV